MTARDDRSDRRAPPSRRDAALLEISTRLAGLRDPAVLLAALAPCLAGVVECACLGIVLHQTGDENARLWLRDVAARVDAGAQAPGTAIQMSGAAEAWLSGPDDPLPLTDLDRERRFPELVGELRDRALRSVWLFPLLSSGRRLGVLVIDGGPSALTEADRIFLRIAAGTVAMAVDSSLDLDRAHAAQTALARERDHLRLLLDINNAVASTFDVGEALAAIASSLKRMMPHEYLVLHLEVPRTGLVAVYALDLSDGKRLLRECLLPAEDVPAILAMTANGPVMVTRDLLEEPQESGYVRRMLTDRVRSGCALPLVVDGRPFGMLLVASFTDEVFPAVDATLLQPVADQIAMGVEEAVGRQHVADLAHALVSEELFADRRARPPREDPDTSVPPREGRRVPGGSRHGTTLFPTLHHALTDRIRNALAENRFVLYGQPILNLACNEISQYELLLRLSTADGPLLPGSFLSIAERFGLTVSIDCWVVQEAAALIARQATAGCPLTLNVNISGHSVGSPELIAAVDRALRETAADPASLVFELTETAAIANLEEATILAHELRTRGCRFALDDFGVGFNSFAYLKHIPFDYLKIDGDFIRGLAVNPIDELVVDAIVGIARRMGKMTVAEFVTDAKTAQWLHDSGVDFAQGFEIGRPRPFVELLEHMPCHGN